MYRALLLVGIGVAVCDTITLQEFIGNKDCSGTPSSTTTARGNSCTKNEPIVNGQAMTVFATFVGTCTDGGELLAFGTDDCRSKINSVSIPPKPNSISTEDLCVPIGNNSGTFTCTKDTSSNLKWWQIALIVAAVLLFSILLACDGQGNTRTPMQ